MTAQPITASEARAQGFAPLTNPFRECETPLLESALAGMHGASVVLVAVPGGIEIWRLSKELKNA